MEPATRQHISSGVSTTSPPSRIRERSPGTRNAGSVHLPTFDGRVSDSMRRLLRLVAGLDDVRQEHSAQRHNEYPPICCGDRESSTQNLAVVKKKGIHRPSTGCPRIDGARWGSRGMLLAVMRPLILGAALVVAALAVRIPTVSAQQQPAAPGPVSAPPSVVGRVLTLVEALEMCFAATSHH